MTETWRPLALAAALIVTVAAAATAQTVIVTRTPPGTAVELGVNATAAGKATSDAKGTATIPLNTLEPAKSPTGKTEMDVRVFVDVCEKARHVWLAERGWQPPAVEAGCSRREMFGVFSLQRITSLVIEASEENQSVWIRQGAVPTTWVDPNLQLETTREKWEMATGLVLFGGAGFGKYLWSDLVACGNSTDSCVAANYHMTYRAGVAFWLNRFVGVTGGYFKASQFKTRGAGSGYRFTTTLAPDVATVGAIGGFSIGRARVYAEGGGTYERSNLQTTESINPILGNDGSVSSEGGTQVLNLQTSGWAWYAAGGMEVWVNNKWGLFGEMGRMGINGQPRAGGEGYLNETVAYTIGGVRLRLR
jgi:hypothetical protein